MPKQRTHHDRLKAQLYSASRLPTKRSKAILPFWPGKVAWAGLAASINTRKHAANTTATATNAIFRKLVLLSLAAFISAPSVAWPGTSPAAAFHVTIAPCACGRDTDVGHMA
jgi:hypothetical protein